MPLVTDWHCRWTGNDFGGTDNVAGFEVATGDRGVR
jgi:hypothetical protein